MSIRTTNGVNQALLTLEQKRKMISTLAQSLGELLQGTHAMVATAESCTGGWVSEAITEVPGCSEWFDRGFVTYSNQAKKDMLGVKASSLERNGAVSEKVVCEMAKGALKHSKGTYALAISGVAGPTGGTDEKPVGTVWFAWASRQGVECSQMFFDGDRQDIRASAVLFALQGLNTRIRGWRDAGSPATKKEAMAARQEPPVSVDSGQNLPSDTGAMARDVA
jgi:nicotinamide-nucleotide amidase